MSLDSQKYSRELRALMEKDECIAFFTVSHPTLSTQQISELLQLEPVYALEDGDTIYESKRHHITQTGSYWRIEVCETGCRISSEQLLSDLIAHLSGKLPTIRRLQNEGAKMSLNLHYTLASNVSSLELSPDLLTQLFQLRIRLRVMTIKPVDE